MLGPLIHLHVVISSKNKQKQRVTVLKTLAGQMKPPHTLLTWGGTLFELLYYWLASDDMLQIHVLQHFNLKLY